jgi:hypothetical protein
MPSRNQRLQLGVDPKLVILMSEKEKANRGRNANVRHAISARELSLEKDGYQLYEPDRK